MKVSQFIEDLWCWKCQKFRENRPKVYFFANLENDGNKMEVSKKNVDPFKIFQIKFQTISSSSIKLSPCLEDTWSLK